MRGLGIKDKPGPGRPKGSANKLTADIKQMLMEALDESGGKDYFVEQAKKNPAAFMTLIGKVLPTQVSGTLEVTTMSSILSELDGRASKKIG
jgi:hypothetical protein